MTPTNTVRRRPFSANSGSERKYIDHFDARTLESALELLGRYMGEAKIIGGGLDVISLLRKQVLAPNVLVNIKTVPSLVYITEDAEA